MIKSKLCIDRLLPTPKTRIMAARTAVAENNANAPEIKSGIPTPLGLALLTDKKWAIGRTLECGFLHGTITQKRRVEEIAHKVEEFANIKFRFTNNPKAEIRITFTEGIGSWSYIGTDCLYIKEGPTVNFGWLYDDSDEREYTSLVYHELAGGHATGFGHELSSPGSTVRWNREAVIRDLSGPPNNWTIEDIENNVFFKYDQSVAQYSDFDPYSIMTYHIPDHWVLGGVGTPWNYELSDTDKKYLRKFYPFSDLHPNGKPRSLTMPTNVLKQLNLVLAPGEEGLYNISLSPDTNSWISIVSADGTKNFSKDPITMHLSTGKNILKFRNVGPLAKFKAIVNRLENP